jgi:hypothetical protein
LWRFAFDLRAKTCVRVCDHLMTNAFPSVRSSSFLTDYKFAIIDYAAWEGCHSRTESSRAFVQRQPLVSWQRLYFWLVSISLACSRTKCRFTVLWRAFLNIVFLQLKT